jgi:cytochrome c oxidase cbb3-type subunit 4
MDINDLRSAITLLSFAVFTGVLAWAWMPRRLADFEEAARLPFAEEGDRP